MFPNEKLFPLLLLLKCVLVKTGAHSTKGTKVPVNQGLTILEKNSLRLPELQASLLKAYRLPATHIVFSVQASMYKTA